MNARALRLLSAAPLLLMLAAWVGCIEPMSVGLSPLATVDASITAVDDASLADAAIRDAGTPVDSGARPVDASAAQPSDAAFADAQVRDASVIDAATSDAAPRDAAVDTGSPDAGLERCEERLCAIAGISPRDTSCPSGQESACLREESGMCSWYCL
jgi:hypothetical protein